MKRIFLFLLVNMAVMLALSVTYGVVAAFLPELAGEMSEEGLAFANIAVWAAVFGMGGAFISLLISKPMAKWMTGAKTIDGTEGEDERWIVQTVRDLAMRANVSMPEVAIYPGEPNAFATGAFKNHALVAVSTGIMERMDRGELRAVLGHEMSHVSNGDMVTLTLVQGVLNAVVLFLSRVVAFVAARAASGGRDRRGGSSSIYYLVYYVLQISLGLLASLVVCAYSRRREYAADAGSARLLGTPVPMMEALRRLGGLEPGVLPDSMRAMGIGSRRRASLFATHPSIEDRINALSSWTPSM